MGTTWGSMWIIFKVHTPKNKALYGNNTIGMTSPVRLLQRAHFSVTSIIWAYEADDAGYRETRVRRGLTHDVITL